MIRTALAPSNFCDSDAAIPEDDGQADRQGKQQGLVEDRD